MLHENQRLKVRIKWSLCVLALSLLGACAETEHVRRPRAPWQGDQGGGAELVFPGADIASGLADSERGWEAARNDARLASRPTIDGALAGAYPGVPAPSLDDLRVRTLRHNPDAVYYYSRQPSGAGYQREPSRFQSFGGQHYRGGPHDAHDRGWFAPGFQYAPTYPAPRSHRDAPAYPHAE